MNSAKTGAIHLGVRQRARPLPRTTTAEDLANLAQLEALAETSTLLSPAEVRKVKDRVRKHALRPRRVAPVPSEHNARTGGGGLVSLMEAWGSRHAGLGMQLAKPRRGFAVEDRDVAMELLNVPGNTPEDIKTRREGVDIFNEVSRTPIGAYSRVLKLRVSEALAAKPKSKRVRK